MERFAWKAVVKDGMLSEYKKRHDNIWPELKQVLKESATTPFGTPVMSCLAILSATRAWPMQKNIRRPVP